MSTAFADIKDSIRLCYFYPMHYKKYPIMSIKDRNPDKHFNGLNLKGDVVNLPIMAEIRFSKKEFDLEEKLISAYKSFVAFKDDKTLSKFDLNIYTVFRKSNNPQFPKTQAIIHEYY